MRRLLISLVAIAGFATVAVAQGSAPTVNAPSPADNANPRDNNIKLRSVELERVKRDADKGEIKPGITVNSQVDQKFPEIKEDFEGIQLADEAIIKTYTTGKTIDMTLVASSADDIYRHASRLEGNLFTSEVEKPKKSGKKQKDKENVAVNEPVVEPELPTTMKDLIVSLDGAIGRLTSNSMFSNLRVVNPDDAAKAHDDVILIKRISVKLSEMAKSGKQ